MEHSAKYKEIKAWYGLKMWDENRINDAVQKNWITEEEALKILHKNVVVTVSDMSADGGEQSLGGDEYL